MKNITNVIVFASMLGIGMNQTFAAGTASAQFLKMGAGARAAAMGDAYTAVSNDVTAAYWNPAGLAQVESTEISLMHNSALVDTQYQYFGAAKPLGKNTLAASIYRMDYGSIDGYDNNDAKTGSFDAGNLAASFSVARKVNESLFLGMSGKFISESIESESASTFAGDFGIFFKERKLNRFNLGATIQNLGAGMKFVKETESLPRILRAGVSTSLLDGKLLTALDISKPSDNDASINMGLEYKINPLLNLRGGYKLTPGNNIDVDGLTNVTAGLGLNLNKLSFDYAFVPFGDLGSMHRVSLLFRFSPR